MVEEKRKSGAVVDVHGDWDEMTVVIPSNDSRYVPQRHNIILLFLVFLCILYPLLEGREKV